MRRWKICTSFDGGGVLILSSGTVTAEALFTFMAFLRSNEAWIFPTSCPEPTFKLEFYLLSLPVTNSTTVNIVEESLCALGFKYGIMSNFL
jgi:hypothetical protein